MKWNAACRTKALAQDVKTLVSQYYKEPVDEKFEDVTATILNNIDSDTDEEMVLATDGEPKAADNTN